MQPPPDTSEERLFQQALLLAEEGKHAEVLKALKPLLHKSIDPRHFVAYGMSLQALGHWKESVRMFQRAIDLKPHYCEGDTRLFLAASLLESGEKKQAIEQWRMVAAMKPEYPSYEAVPNEAKRWLEKYDA